MNTKMVFAPQLLAGALLLSLIKQSNAQPPTANPPRFPNIQHSTSSGSTGYQSGGERGSIIRVVSNHEAREDLQLSPAQQQQVDEVLNEIAKLESAHFLSFNQSMQAAMQNRREAAEVRNRQLQEMRAALSQTTAAILQELTAPQKTRLEAIRKRDITTGASRGGQSQPGAGFGGGSSSGGGGGGGSMLAGPGFANGPAPANHSYTAAGGPGAVVYAIRRPEVQTELQLSPQQRDRINELLTELEKTESRGMPNPREAAGQFARQQHESRQQKDRQVRQQVEALGQQIEGFLTPQQRERVRQLQLQALGSEALTRPEIIRSLGISTVQQARYANLKQEENNRISTVLQASQTGGAAQDPGSQILAIRHETEEKLMKLVLKPDQKSRLLELRGKELPSLSPLNNPVQSASGSSSNYSTSGP